MRIGSPGRIVPAVTTMAMMPALRTRLPAPSPPQRRRHEAGLEMVHLEAGIAQACNLDRGRVAEMQDRAARQRQQIDAARRDVLAEEARRQERSPPSRNSSNSSA